jgi:hypothetical protein
MEIRIASLAVVRRHMPANIVACTQVDIHHHQHYPKCTMVNMPAYKLDGREESVPIRLNII